MEVMYTCDNNYVWLMGISTISLLENNKHLQDLTVYLLGENISNESKVELKKIGEKYSRDIIIIDVPKLNIPPSLVSARWPLSAYTRLFSGIILPQDVDRILYLDCDTIISGDISELDRIEFNGNIVMGIKDCISGTYKKNIGLYADSPYFNAGVLYFDMNALRKFDVINEIETYMSKYEKLINYADQDVLNGMFKGKIGELDPKYDVMTIDVVHTYKEIKKLRKPTNFYTEQELSKAVKSPVIIHYTTNMLIIRPWFSNTDHPLANYFSKYLQLSPWKDKELTKMVFTAKEAKVIKLISKFPMSMAYTLLGLIHAEWKPKYIKMRASR